MIILGYIAAGIVVLYLLGYYQQIKYKKRILAEVRRRYGNCPDREYTADELERISRYFYHTKKDEFCLDDITWNDLDMDDVFIRINQTFSSVGEEYLYKLLRTPLLDQDSLMKREKLIRFFQDPGSQKAREEISAAYAHLGRTVKISLADYVNNLRELPERSCVHHYIQLALLVLSGVGILINPATFIMVFVACAGYSIYSYYREKGDVEPYFACIQYLVGIYNFGREMEKIREKELKPYLDRIRTGCQTLKPLSRRAFLLSSGNGMNASLMDTVLDFVRMFTHIDLIAFWSMAKTARDCTDDIYGLLDELGLLESCISLASYRESLDYYCTPCWEEGNHIGLTAKELYHPLIEEPVANSISEKGCVLLTGSNASGKSTFLKSVAVNAVLAQAACMALAEEYRAGFFRIYSSMALRDSILNKESYYMVEIRSLKRILTAAREETRVPVLCFIDEVLRGTNTVERIAASTQILKYLAKENVMCFAATHDIELTELLKNEYANYHFTEEVTDNDVHFSYVLHKGKAQTRNAIRLLHMMGYPDAVIQAANASAERFTQNGSWSLA